MKEKKVQKYMLDLVIEHVIAPGRPIAQFEFLRRFVRRYLDDVLFMSRDTVAQKIPDKYTNTIILLPTRSLNAVIHRIPDTDHFLFILDDQMPIFLNTIGKISSYAYSAQVLFRSTGNIKSKKKIKEIEGKALDKFAWSAALMLTMFFSFVRLNGKIGFEMPPFSGPLHLDMIGSLMRDHMYRFVFAHEVGHAVNGDLNDSCDQTLIDIGSKKIPIFSPSWEREYKADEFAIMTLLKQVDTSDRDKLMGQGSMLLSVWSLLIAFSLLEGFQNYLQTGKFDERTPASPTHPPARTRLDRIERIVDGYLEEQGWRRSSAFIGLLDDVPFSQQFAFQANAIRSAWEFNVEKLPPEPDPVRLEKIWRDITALVKKHAEPYFTYAPVGNSKNQLGT